MLLNLLGPQLMKLRLLVRILFFLLCGHEKKKRKRKIELISITLIKKYNQLSKKIKLIKNNDQFNNLLVYYNFFGLKIVNSLAI
jgi:hypothetical protein